MAFDLIEYTVENRPMLLPDGTRLPDEQQVQVGAKFKQWTDETLSRSWFLQARKYLDDTAELAECDKPYRADPAQGARQRAFVMRVANAIAKAYDALNVVAMNDIKTRYAYFRWISGTPFGRNRDEQLQNWFKAERNFGGGDFLDRSKPFGRWYVPNEPAPVFGESKDGATWPGGLIPSMALNGYTKFMHLVPCELGEFVISAGVTLRPDPGSAMTAAASAEYQPYTRNEAFVRTDITAMFGVLPDGTVIPQLPGIVELPFDWRAVYANSCLGKIGRPMTTLIAPLRMYLDYFNEIVEAALARTTSQIVQDTISFVTWLNYSAMTSYGTASQFMAAVSNNDARVQAMIDAPDANIQLASASVASIGGAAAAALGAVNPIVGGITALVTGVISGILKIVDVLTPGRVTGKGKDEFGRYKPMLERSTLSGSTSNEFSGRPLITGLSDPPIGRLTEYMIFDRVRRALEKLAVRRLMQQGAPTLDAFDWDRFKLPPPPEEDSSPLLWLLAAAGVVGGAVAWKRRKRKA